MKRMDIIKSAWRFAVFEKVKYSKLNSKDGYLKITATRNINKEDTRVLRQERFTGTYSRSFYIGEGYKQEDIKARFDNGELFILLPTKPVKHEEETRYINIQ